MGTTTTTLNEVLPLSVLFPKASVYSNLVTNHIQAVCEAHALYQNSFHWSERHLQCLWFDSRYRPEIFHLPNGETVTVLDPGEWNLEAGPDFLNASLLIQPGARQIRGDVEIHIHPSDWDAHNHQHDPAYQHLIAHVTWFAGQAPSTLSADVHALSFADPRQASQKISLDDIDLTAYPHALLPITPRPCQLFFEDHPDHSRAILLSAGHYRLKTKAARLRARLLQNSDRNQLFYEEVMAALGYKYNQEQFRRLARLIPVNTLPISRETAFAYLLGTAKLLPQPESAADVESARFIRVLWDLWWHHSHETLPDDMTWRLHNLRPQNTPIRRLAAAASLFSGLSNIRHALDNIANTANTFWHEQARTCFETRCLWPFWNQRLTFGSAVDTMHETALLGASRIATILTNVVLPFAAAEGCLPDGALENMPPEDLSSPMRLAANHLFGRDHNPALYASNGLLQQGLLQIHLDFCLNAKPGCEACHLYATLQKTMLSIP